MKNSEVARVLNDIADLLELKGENIFKVRAYQRAAYSIERSSIEIDKMAAEDRLREISGVGEAIAQKVTELVTTGKLAYYEKLKTEFPPGVSSLLTIPGIGPKKAKQLAQELGVASIDELEAAVVSGRVAQLQRMGEKTSENIRHQLENMRRKGHRILLGEALPIVEEIIGQLKLIPGIRNISPAGSVRRFLETVGDIDLIGTAHNDEKVIDAFIHLPLVKEVIASGNTKASVLVAGDLQVDLRIVEHEAFGSLLQHFTGNKQHNIILRDRANRLGLSLSEYGITDTTSGKLEKFYNEVDFYARQGLQWIPPEIRQGENEITKAEEGAIPKLIEVTDLKGDLHVHTNWSDGHDNIENMALAARDMGYEYIAITDHSAGRGIAHGLSIERLRQQIEHIRQLNQRLSGIRIFTGIEVDIRADGKLDAPEEILEELDIVTAAIHSSMHQTREQMTKRIIWALENPHVDILTHPTCRLLSEREPVSVDMEALYQAAVRTGTILEINSMPSRLDLKDTHIYRARELGVKMVINTDAHAAEHLSLNRFGVGQARRGWCRPEDIGNTLSLSGITGYVKSLVSKVG